MIDKLKLVNSDTDIILKIDEIIDYLNNQEVWNEEEKVLRNNKTVNNDKQSKGMLLLEEARVYMANDCFYKSQDTYEQAIEQIIKEKNIDISICQNNHVKILSETIRVYEERIQELKAQKQITVDEKIITELQERLANCNNLMTRVDIPIILIEGLLQQLGISNETK
jgi:rubrerythrin